MTGFISSSALAQASESALPGGVPLPPLLILVLCVIGGVGTVLLLPSRREASLRKVGGVILLATGLILAAVLVRWAAGNAAWGTRAHRVYFWIFSTIALVGAVRVISHTRPVYSALYFVLTVFASAGLFLLLWAEFMAAALVLIYAGAILITYVFVIMLAADASGPTGRAVIAEHDTVSRDPVLASAVGFALMGVILFIVFDKYQAIAPQPAAPGMPGATQQLGQFLFTQQIMNLELAGLILTVAMVGAIVIARRRVHLEATEVTADEPAVEVVLGPATPADDNPHSIPVYGTSNPRQKAYPEA
ncbi:NADH-quinone oxidoreductase subunit J family protein [Fontivita pretiosa]|jgi:NADH-quinone oxidoreductase subunit J|uniref:NADH-quinone oxidoreductase subunit J family protein n=1 Tax=Fontivita pretiosa TaxID=2989684 RepID=UPI003D17388A